MTVPEMYFAECVMVAPKGNATSHEEMVLELVEAYVGTAENVAECNILRRNGLELQRKLSERVTESNK